MGFLSDWPFQGMFFESPPWYLEWSELDVPDYTRYHRWVAHELPSYSRDIPPPPALTVVYGQAQEIEVLARNLFTHGPSFFPRFDESGPSQKDKVYLPSKSDTAKNLTWSSKSDSAKNQTWLCLPSSEPDIGSAHGDKTYVPTSRSDRP